MKKAVLFLIVVAFVAGYIAGAREGTDAIRMGDLERFLIYWFTITLGLGMGVVILGAPVYYLYLQPLRKKLTRQREGLEHERDALQRERARLKTDMKERIKRIVRRCNENVEERLQEFRREAEMFELRALEEGFEDEANPEGERPHKIQKTIPGAPPTFQASDGKTYARLRVGPPVERKQGREQRCH